MTSDLLDPDRKTAVAQLDPKLAAAVCYLPVSFLNVVAAAVWLATEPKDSRFVRFHAAQSLLLFGTMLGGAMLGLALMILLPMLSIVASTFVAVLAPGDLAELLVAPLSVVTGVSYVGGLLLALGCSLLSLPAMLFTGFLAFSGKEARWPILAQLAGWLA